jgi:hypothetical protein
MRRTPWTVGIFFFVNFAGAPVGAANHLWTEATSGQPGEEVTVIVKATSDQEIEAATAVFGFPPSELTYLGHDFSACFFAKATTFTFVNAELVPGELLLSVNADPQGEPLPAGENGEFCRLFFRVRATAQPGDCPASLIAHSASQPWENLFAARGFDIPVTFDPGVIVIKPASGPLPPDELSCTQRLGSVELAWLNSIAYDDLTLRRDGVVIAQLAGTIAAFADSQVPVGTHVYALTGSSNGASTVEVQCRIAVHEPSAEPVEELVCASEGGSATLSWQPGMSYTSIEIRRNGASVAVLPGPQTTFVDGDKPQGTVLYEVVGYVESIGSPPVPCVADGVWTVRMGSVTVPPGGGEVLVPVYCTNPEPTTGFVVGFGYDPSRLTVKTHSIEGTALATYPDFFRFDTIGADDARFAFEFCSPGCWTIPPAVESCYLKVVLEVSPLVQAGEVIPLELRHGVGSPPHDTCFVEQHNLTCFLAQLVSGEIIVGKARVKSVRGLSAGHAKGDGSVELRWVNAEPYDAIEVERNGQVIRTLPGSDETVTAPASGAGVEWYRVRGVRGGVRSPWALAVHTELGGTVLFRRGDGNGDGRVDIGDAISIYVYLFRHGVAPCEDAMDANDDGGIDIADAILLLAYLFKDVIELPSPGAHVRWYDPTPDNLGCEQGTP